MGVLDNLAGIRLANLGQIASKASGTITGDPTTAIFTVAGGEVLLTALWLKVTTAITTDSGTLAINLVPTTGDTQILVSATDLGTTNTTAGTTVGLTRGTTAIPAFLRAGTIELGVPAVAGTINLIGAASANGAVTVYVGWYPLVAGATLVAA